MKRFDGFKSLVLTSRFRMFCRDIRVCTNPMGFPHHMNLSIITTTNYWQIVKKPRGAEGEDMSPQTCRHPVSFTEASVSILGVLQICYGHHLFVSHTHKVARVSSPPLHMLCHSCPSIGMHTYSGNLLFLYTQFGDIKRSKKKSCPQKHYSNPFPLLYRGNF